MKALGRQNEDDDDDNDDDDDDVDDDVDDDEYTALVEERRGRFDDG